MGPDDGTSGKVEFVHSSDVEPSQKLEAMISSSNRNVERAGIIVQGRNVLEK